MNDWKRGQVQAHVLGLLDVCYWSREDPTCLARAFQIMADSDGMTRREFAGVAAGYFAVVRGHAERLGVCWEAVAHRLAICRKLAYATKWVKPL